MNGPDELGAAAGRPEGPSVESAALTQFLAELRSLGETTAPTPTPELEAVFAATPPSRTRRRYARIAWRAALVAAAVIAGTVSAAANHSLPAPAQRVVSNVVNNVTPFHIGTTPQKPLGPTPSRRDDDSGTTDRSGTRDDRGGENDGRGAIGDAMGSQDATERSDDNSGGRAGASGNTDHSAAGDETDSGQPSGAGQSGPEGDG